MQLLDVAVSSLKYYIILNLQVKLFSLFDSVEYAICVHYGLRSYLPYGSTLALACVSSSSSACASSSVVRWTDPPGTRVSHSARRESTHFSDGPPSLIAWWKCEELKEPKDIRCLLIFFLVNVLFGKLLLLVGKASWLLEQWKYLVRQQRVSDKRVSRFMQDVSLPVDSNKQLSLFYFRLKDGDEGCNFSAKILNLTWDNQEPPFQMFILDFKFTCIFLRENNNLK